MNSRIARIDLVERASSSIRAAHPESPQAWNLGTRRFVPRLLQSEHQVIGPVDDERRNGGGLMISPQIR